jgi:hypothetical protein
MQLRSGKTNSVSPIKNKFEHLEATIRSQLYYKSFQSIVDLLHENFRKINVLETNSLERIDIFRTIFELVQTKIIEINYLKDDPAYISIKKLYLSIKNKIPELIQDISIKMIEKIDLDDKKIEEMTDCLCLLTKIRMQLK